MIDLILQATDRQTLVAFGRANNLLRQVDDEWELRPGVSFSWWAGSGKMMRSPGEYDEEGNQTIAPTFVPGLIALVRIGGEAGAEDALNDTPEDESDVKEWERSKIARYIRRNGVQGEVAGLTYFEIDDVRIFRRKDISAKLAEWGVPDHVYL
jgi:hypothetical protein